MEYLLNEINELLKKKEISVTEMSNIVRQSKGRPYVLKECSVTRNKFITLDICGREVPRVDYGFSERGLSPNHKSLKHYRDTLVRYEILFSKF